MGHVQRVVICGTSVYQMSIEAGLAKLPGMEVVRLNPHLPSAEARTTALEPDVVLVERDERPEGLVLAILDCGFPLIELDADKGGLTILDRRQVPAQKVEDLAQQAHRGGGQTKPQVN